MKRNYGIDALRIVSMVFVIVLHLMGIGGICGNAVLFSPQFFVSQFLRTATYCAVNCYALISGFVGWNRTPKLSALLKLWVKVVLFCVSITIFSWLRDPAAVGLLDLLKAFTPVNAVSYWYFNAYVGLFFFIPLLNCCIRNISGRDAVFALTGIFLVVAGALFSGIRDTLLLSNGYSTFWLIILYLAGGLMSRFGIHKRCSAGGWCALYLLGVLLSYVPRMALLMWKPELWTPETQNLAMQYISPSVILAAVALVGLFARLELPEGLIRFTKAVSPHAFGVYLFHTHPQLFLPALSERFAWLGTAPVWELAAGTAGTVVLICAIGTASDWLLTQLIKLIPFDRLTKKPDALV